LSYYFLFQSLFIDNKVKQLYDHVCQGLQTLISHFAYKQEGSGEETDFSRHNHCSFPRLHGTFMFG